MMEAISGAVRVIHIGSGIALAGGGFLWTFVVAPNLTRRLAGPKLGDLMMGLGPALGRYFSILSYVVFLSGATLLASIWGWKHVLGVLLSGGLYGTILSIGILAFLVGFVIAETVLLPNGRKLTTLPLPPPEVAQKLARQQGLAFIAIAVVDIIALTMMALAVNARA